MTEGDRLAQAAASMLGVRFKLHGRSSEFGLDCVGLVATSLAMIGREPFVPSGYRLRNSSVAQWLGEAARSGLREVNGPIDIGDILLTQPGPGQSHLMIAAPLSQVIHAHAGLGRVVIQPCPAEIAILKHWRLNAAEVEI